VLEDLRSRLGYRAALRAARRRTPTSAPGRLLSRRVLILLPPKEDDLRAAWRFVQALDEPPAHLVPALTVGRVPYAPDAFAGHVQTVGEQERDWLGIPARSARERLWTPPPQVALDLNPSFDLAAAYLVGASPARFRAGLYGEEREPFYDLLIRPKEGYAAALEALRGYLAAIEPPVVAFHG
jgi:hypothetical protein